MAFMSVAEWKENNRNLVNGFRKLSTWYDKPSTLFSACDSLVHIMKKVLVPIQITELIGNGYSEVFLAHSGQRLHILSYKYSETDITKK